MSNFLAIATVTETLRRTLTATVGADVPGATAIAVRPDGGGVPIAFVGVNIYLYQVSPNAALRNADLPTRRTEGSLAQRPRAALDLHYLLTFYGDEVVLEPQRCLGSVAKTLHTQPVLTRQGIADAVLNSPFIATSNLADEVELVKFTPSLLTLEELSKLWSVFFQTQYTLSVAYQASVVLIEPEIAPRRQLPVRERRVRVLPFRQPSIERIESSAGEDEPILAGSTLVIHGQRLRGEATRVRIGRFGLGVVVPPQEVEETRISFLLQEGPNLLPPDSLRAGANGALVVHDLIFGTPGDPHRGFESNVAAFVLHPSITRNAGGTYRIRTINIQPDPDAPNLRQGVVAVTLRPKVGQRQRAVLLLNEFGAVSAAPRAYSFDADPRDVDRYTLRFRIRRVLPGDYLVRVQVDGAESPLDVDPNPDPNSDPDRPTFRYIGPRVTI